MKYTLNGNNLLFAIDRTAIIDISPEDVIALQDFPGAEYTWTSHDAEFLENNPDDDIYLKLERVGENKYEAKAILLKSTVTH